MTLALKETMSLPLYSYLSLSRYSSGAASASSESRTMADVAMASSSTVPYGSPNRTAAYLASSTRYRDVDRILDRRGPWTDEQFQGGQAVRRLRSLDQSGTPLSAGQRPANVITQAKDFLRKQAKILVIGAGGLGCEILQNLALSKL